MVQLISVNVYGQMDPNCGDGINDPCKMANATLAPCDGQLPPIPPKALSGAEPFNYALKVDCENVPDKTPATSFPKKDYNTPNDPCKAVNETLTNCGSIFSLPPKSTSSEVVVLM
ncbi:17298_t:CDS:2, partial [Funneliformis geosporum]